MLPFLGVLGRVLLTGLVAGAVISIVVSFLDSDVLSREVSKKKPDALKAVIKKIIHSGGVAHVSLDAIDDDGYSCEIEIQADDIDESEIYEGNEIYI